ncbi:hypothetical protein ONR75_23935 [Rhodopseudomonas sp. P2A-2r]|uniref:hypothetical protein n=1 Tax=Rhodopseudomonas sp. P2A-2r TaxID=2991972 RepID=UPI0022349FC6|nr:hypothetical protein [Rhodopseudomonas sp. P2A-2r]UZE47892.1 hypothetical protein ONR75_23935 [Rhodopseudomonas sp. P2A-2r]
MKKSLVTVLVLGIGAAGAAHAASSDDVAARLTALEKENATIRKENAALRQNKSLREQNATLKSSTAATPVVAAQPGAKRSDPFGAFAADLPLAYKARPVESAGQFRVWGEGGAIWSGGDRLASDYSLLDFSGLGVITGGVSVPGSFDLTPKLGWEAAAGFDYRFAASPWHVSGQFRYGEGKASGFASSAATLDAAQLAQLAQQLGGGLALGGGASASASQSFGATYKETHWLADIAVGRDILGDGASAMQVKFGLRLAEFVGQTSTTQKTNNTQNFGRPVAFGGGGAYQSILSEFDGSNRSAKQFSRRRSACRH